MIGAVSSAQAIGKDLAVDFQTQLANRIVGLIIGKSVIVDGKKVSLDELGDWGQPLAETLGNIVATYVSFKSDPTLYQNISVDYAAEGPEAIKDNQ